MKLAGEEELNKGLKLKQSKRFAKEFKENQGFEERAQDASDQLQQYIRQAAEICQKFLEVLKDKTLPVNKGVLQKNLEKEICGKLQEYIVTVNNDPDVQENDMGSSSAAALLIACTLKLRDRCNENEYNIHLLNKENEFLKKEFLALKAKVSSSSKDSDGL